ncbi:hypothetical protein DKX38_016975 [Salix brachista]|uniref:Retroviral polymerase SH3-like domain-containing protein n=1 Tax=Salix brachista TaxID=2182728 RepID=A0A5N5KU00_9ROSI|nr:hypothetical protein DKX38_016975 [Salix brachista]
MINLSPSVPLEFDVPNIVWKGKDVSYAHLRVFGCRAFVHVPRDERSKLDSKTKQCIFLGSEDDEFGYRLWDPKEKKIVRSRDVIFFEDQTIEDFEQKEKVESTTFIPSNSNPRPTQQLPLMLANHGGDLQNDDNGEASDEPQLRRSTRPRQPSTKYSPHEYVLVTDGGEPEYMMTKPLPREKFEFCRKEVGLVEPPKLKFAIQLEAHCRWISLVALVMQKLLREALEDKELKRALSGANKGNYCDQKGKKGCGIEQKKHNFLLRENGEARIWLWNGFNQRSQTQEVVKAEKVRAE